jgi:hypothetical protein
VIDVFPTIYTLSLADASPGSLVILPHSMGHMLAIVTADSTRTDARSIVILNFKEPNYPPVIYEEDWSGICLSYDAPLRFELSNSEK